MRAHCLPDTSLHNSLRRRFPAAQRQACHHRTATERWVISIVPNQPPHHTHLPVHSPRHKEALREGRRLRENKG